MLHISTVCVPWFVSKMINELFNCLIQFILSNKISTVMAHLWKKTKSSMTIDQRLIGAHWDYDRIRVSIQFTFRIIADLNLEQFSSDNKLSISTIKFMILHVSFLQVQVWQTKLYFFAVKCAYRSFSSHVAQCSWKHQENYDGFCLLVISCKFIITKFPDLWTASNTVSSGQNQNIQHANFY